MRDAWIGFHVVSGWAYEKNQGQQFGMPDWVPCCYWQRILIFVFASKQVLRADYSFEYINHPLLSLLERIKTKKLNLGHSLVLGFVRH